MPHEQLNWFNHTDPECRFTPAEEMVNLDNQYFQRLNDRIRYFCPTKGENLQPTQNTLYGRSELREWDAVHNKKAEVLLSDYPYNFMAVRQCIGELGPAGRAICLQIHGSSNSPICKMQWRRNNDGLTANLYFQRRPTYLGAEEKEIILRNMPMYQVYDLAIGFTPTMLFVAANWNTDTPVYREIPLDYQSYATDPQYFKSGIYCQTNIAVPYEEQLEGWGIIDIFDMKLHHGDFTALPDFDQSTDWQVGESATDVARLTRLLPELFQPQARDVLQLAMDGLMNGDDALAHQNLDIIQTAIDWYTPERIAVFQRWLSEQRTLVNR